MNTAHERTDAKEDWLTPPWLLARLGNFDLDPCACDTQPWQTAERQYFKAEDGLSKPWFGRVWCNPPYGRAAEPFIKKLAAHGNGLLLIFARVETKTWFRWIWPKADAILFIKGRLRFHRPDGTVADSAGAPSALVAYGAENAVWLASLKDLGFFVPLIR